MGMLPMQELLRPKQSQSTVRLWNTALVGEVCVSVEAAKYVRSDIAFSLAKMHRLLTRQYKSDPEIQRAVSIRSNKQKSRQGRAPLARNFWLTDWQVQDSAGAARCKQKLDLLTTNSKKTVLTVNIFDATKTINHKKKLQNSNKPQITILWRKSYRSFKEFKFLYLLLS